MRIRTIARATVVMAAGVLKTLKYGVLIVNTLEIEFKEDFPMHLSPTVVETTLNRLMDEFGFVDDDFEPETADDAVDFIFSFSDPLERQLIAFGIIQRLMSKVSA